jgi:hypothetical protein
LLRMGSGQSVQDEGIEILSFGIDFSESIRFIPL